VYGATLETEYLYNIDKQINILSSASISYIEGTIDLDESGPMPARNLRGVSPWTAKIASTISIGHFYFSPRVQLYTEQRTFDAASVKLDDNNKYQTIPGYILLNATAGYKINKWAKIFVQGTNLLDQRYRNVNIGAAPDSQGAGSSSIEFSKGNGQYPIRIQGGVQLSF
jgi:outer membrane receptor protein involved in Fe transport